MHFKIETVSALPTDRKLRLRADRKSGVPVRQPPALAPLRLQTYRDTARSLGYPIAVVSLVCSKATLKSPATNKESVSISYISSRS